MSILIILLVLSFLVIIHELGHFLTARWAKIKVEEFGIGYPPAAKTLFTDKFGTIFTLNWLPFGGFVRMFGEDGVEIADSGKSYSINIDRSKLSNVYPQDSFAAKPVWQRLIVVLAGAVINFVFGVLAFGLIYGTHGIPEPINGAKIESVQENSPAAEAGLTSGFTVVEVMSADNVVTTIENSQDFISFIQSHRGETVTLTSPDAESRDVYVRTLEETPEGQGATGVSLVDYEVKQYPWYEMPFRGMWVGLKAALNFGVLILQSLGTMLQEMFFMGKIPQDVAGLVGIAHSAEKEGFLRGGFWPIMNFAAVLSINLAIINVLPFPALDGGRAFLLLVEMITRRRVNPRIEQWLNTAGFAMLITLIVAISLRDILRVVRDPSIQQWWQNLINQ